MKRFGIVTGVTAVLGAGGLLVSGMLPSNAATTSASQQVVASSNTQTSAVVFVQRGFNHSSRGYHATADLPKDWRHVVLGTNEARFIDPDVNRMIRFDTEYSSTVTTANAVKQKIAALQGTPGLKVLSTSTKTMGSTMDQGPQTVSTLIYTYRSGNVTRWVATRYVGQHGWKEASIEMSVGGSTADSKLLTTVLDRATLSVTLYG